MPSYERADKDILDLIHQVMHEHHQRLEAYAVKVGAVMAYASQTHGKPAGPALKLHGVPCAATIQLTTRQQRAAVANTPDAIITIDGDRWEHLSPQQRQALIDHELTHLAPVLKDGQAVIEDDGRCKLTLRLHDWDLSGFAEVVTRHGADALEAAAARELMDKHGQLLLWASDPKAVG